MNEPAGQQEGWAAVCFDRSREGMLVWSPTGALLECNPAAERLLGLTRDQLRGAAALPSEWRLVDQLGRRFSLRGEVTEGTLVRVQSPGAADRWLEWRASHVRDGDGAALGLVALLADLTDVRGLADRLALSEARLDAAFHDSDHGLYDWDLQKDHVVRSVRIYRMLGYKPGDIGPRGADWLALIHPDDLIALQGVEERMQAGESKLVVEYRVRDATGAYRWIRNENVATRRSPSGALLQLTGTMRDVHERRGAQEAVALQRQRAERAEAALDALKRASVSPEEKKPTDPAAHGRVEPRSLRGALGDPTSSEDAR